MEINIEYNCYTLQDHPIVKTYRGGPLNMCIYNLPVERVFGSRYIHFLSAVVCYKHPYKCNKTSKKTRRYEITLYLHICIWQLFSRTVAYECIKLV